MAGRTQARWTQDEDTLMQRMRLAGATFEEVAVQVGRAVSTVHNRVRWISMTPEQRAMRATRIRERKREKPSHPYLRGTGIRELNDYVRITPCPQALAERAWRARLAPRDLTASFMGDPLPGFSALDRR